MDMVLYALLKKEIQNFEYVSGFKIMVVESLPENIEPNVIYIVNPKDEVDS